MLKQLEHCISVKVFMGACDSPTCFLRPSWDLGNDVLSNFDFCVLASEGPVFH